MPKVEHNAAISGEGMGQQSSPPVTKPEQSSISDNPPKSNSSTDMIRIPLPSTVAHTRPLHHLFGIVSLPETAEDKQSRSGSPIKRQTTQQASVSPRYAKLQQSIDMLRAQIAEKQKQLDRNLENFRQHDASMELEDNERTLHSIQEVVARHIKLLHHYNEIKDIGLGLMGLIADREGKRLGDVMKERDMNDKD